ncbi:MAG: leucyl aminopeptidase [Deltaproteobacteria bacterium]|nr:leucyl aminopeptidase [Deltaproteobacteria bacterium]
MKIRVKKGPLAAERSDAVVAGVFEGAKKLSEAAAALDRATGGLISAMLTSGDFTGKLHKTAALYPEKKLRLKRIVLVGLGREKDFTRDRLRGAASAAACAVRDLAVTSMLLPLDFAGIQLSAYDTARALVEGVMLGLYQFKEYKTKNNGTGGKPLTLCTLLAGKAAGLAGAKKGAAQAEAVSRAVCLARDLVNRPSNTATPEHLARAAKSIAAQHGIGCTVLGSRQAQKLGMGAFCSVARGSNEPARFIVLDYKPRIKKPAPAIVLIGKAITFDSGGISIKPAQGMEEMKTDMAGGAAVLGVLQAAAALKLAAHVVGIIPATENMPSGHALKPGDIIQAMSGKTIEIISTDAEGRLILADSLTYAQRYKPAAIIDLATLTGACIIALGHAASGLMSTDEKLIKKIQAAAEATGEKVWPLPLYEEYAEQLKSDVADLKNTGGRPAGAITAGCFLKEFAGAVPWAHIDIAGTAWAAKPLPYRPKGASGVGVRLLMELLEQWVEATGA